MHYTYRSCTAEDRCCITEDLRCSRQGWRCIEEDWRCTGQGWRCITEDWRSTRQDWRCNRKVQTCPPFGACRRTYCGPLIAPKEHLRPTGMMFVRTYVRTCVRVSRWKILFAPYLVVELSPRAEIWCVYVTSINDGAQILKFLGIHNNRVFLNSRFICGNLVILNPELH